MPKIYIEINRAINFNIDIYDTLIGEKFFNQHVEITKQDPVRAIPVITDFTKYTINYFIKLIEEAHDTNTVDWSMYNIQAGPEHYESNQLCFNLMHKDLEVTAGINKYDGLDKEQIKLVDDLHCCLHSLETTEAPLDYNFTERTSKRQSNARARKIRQGTQTRRSAVRLPICWQGTILLHDA